MESLLRQETNKLGKLYVLNELMRTDKTPDTEETAEERVEVRGWDLGEGMKRTSFNHFLSVHLSGIGGSEALDGGTLRSGSPEESG